MIINFIKKQLLVILLLYFFSTNIFSQEVPVHISGKIISSETQEPIQDASIQILSANLEEGFTGIGISTKKDGTFDFHFTSAIPFIIRVTHVSFRPYQLVINQKGEGLNITIPLSPNILGEDVVVTAPLVTENELKETKTIDRISTVDVQQLASFDVFDLVSTLREVDVATQSMTMQSVNTRGFNSSANKRFLQLTDRIDNRAPGLSFPIGNLMGLPGLDIASVEILPGPSSSRFGSSAINGVMIMTGRDPFEDQGLTIEAKTGVNNFNLNGSTFFSADGNGMYDFQGRYAKALNDKVAFKITGVYTQGTDWLAENYDNIGFGESYSKHPEQPGYNGVNVYGDESFVYQKVFSEEEGYLDQNGIYINPPTQFGPVTRTGYREGDLVDYDIETIRSALSLQYKFTDDYRLKVGGKYGITNSLYTGDSRIRLDEFSMYQTSFEFDLNRLNILGYTTWQNSGNSYDVSSLAQTLIKSSKSDVDWYRDFRIAYENGLPIFGVPSGNVIEARKFADSGYTLSSNADANARFEPQSTEFDQKVNEIIRSTDSNYGAAIKDNSQLYHIQSQYDLPEIINTKFRTGGDFRFYDLDSEGTIFPDTVGNEITNYEYGAYISVEKSSLNGNLNINSAVRFDKNENFEGKISPQISLNYIVKNDHFFRFSYQHGFRYPGVREQFVSNNLGSARLLGGLSKNVESYDLQENAITLDAVNEFNEAVKVRLNESPRSPDSYNRLQAEIENLSILESGIIAADQLLNIKSEIVNTFEVGYKRLFTPEFYLDLNYYISFYKDFIGVTRVVKPRTSPSEDLLIAAGQINNSLESDRYYVYSNARDELMVQGASFALDYISGGFLASLNGSYSKLIQSSQDPITPGFNTPPFKMNFEWGHRSISENVGFKMTYRFRTQYYWESSFLDGPIDTYGHFDFQFNVRIPNAKSTLKFGVTNIGIKEYYNIYGGPSIGSILFVTLNFNPKMFQ